MKLNKTTITVAVIAILVLVGFLSMRSCRSDAKYREMKLQYEGYKAIAEADHKASMDRIEKFTEDILKSDEKIAVLNADIKVKGDKIKALSTQLDELQGQEPPTTPDIEAMPIVINLRAQVARLTEMFPLATDTINDKDDVIREWEAKYNPQVKITLEWKADYDREHQLRLLSEGLVKELEGQVKDYKFTKKVAKVSVAVAMAEDHIV